ncbi:MAG: DUF4240 domain-containing protein [Pseudomonadota bacterium]
MTIDAMPGQRFWAIIEEAAKSAHDPDAHMSALHGELTKLTPDQVASFQVAFMEHTAKAYTWDLWGAAFVVHGGCSDDGFEYFRYWLVSRGRDVFEQAMRDVDGLADLDPPTGPYDAWEFEGIAYIAERAWKDVGGTGRFAAVVGIPTLPDEPAGDPFEEDEDHLKHRFPKLWLRFGETPLG